MPQDAGKNPSAEGAARRRMFYFNAGFLRQKRVRRIMELAGYDLRLGVPSETDQIAVWGHSPYAARGEAMAEKTGAALVRVEDAFLRSLFPGRSGSLPIGLQIDHRGCHFDSAQPSDLEHILANDPLDDTTLLARARGGIERLKEAHLSKYTAFDPSIEPPKAGYVLVVDQTRGDASVSKGRADSNTFREMLYYAQEEHPKARILIKTHPETEQGFREGYYGDDVASERVELYSDPISPWALFDGAIAVYTVSSQMGFEAILSGHRPVVFGQPFYAGWGLSDDRQPVQRRQRSLTRVQLFAGAMILHPTWYDPFRDKLATLEQALDTLEAAARAWREDHLGWHARSMRLWKRKPLQQFFGRYKKMTFGKGAAAKGRREMCWAGKAEHGADTVRVEDGFLRSRGLGAELVPPLSLVCDDLGIYYDPYCESRLEALILKREKLRPDQTLRAEQLMGSLIKAGVNKYNLGGTTPDLPEGHRVLVVGQVEDDASIRTAAGKINTNLALLRAAREAKPKAAILYKPHPDVEAGLRAGAIEPVELEGLADLVLAEADPIALLDEVHEVWTMTSLLGFEALLRGVPVTTMGAPFYAGWGLTNDLGEVPPRRRAEPSLEGLVHATLIDYPRYFDPVTRQPCPVEVVVERLSKGDIPHPGPVNRIVAKLQGAFASYAHLWRR